MSGYKAVTHDGWRIEPGGIIRTKDNVEYEFVRCYGKPPPSTGRVVVKTPGGGLTEYEFYPSVFNLKVVPE